MEVIFRERKELVRKDGKFIKTILNNYRLDNHSICNRCISTLYYQLWCFQVNPFKITLVFAEMLSIILAAIWIIYKLNSMRIDDLVMNLATYSLMIYVAIGNLIEQLS